ncbi:RNA-directed DNA polymerase from mobile element jockey [Paramuricea clavata]|uniref:RNA-directed DNA polymerase from mobile element jockey n=1 Tax=Paramuricea clavata TaxID=317549 RepID=A0A6S7JYM2_PARCT|nr:RNA-directed DNA polymerase from mobile element jockey [Paramuricea clavata]
MDALPPFYRSVMTAWIALERKFVDNEYVICGPRKSVATLEQLLASFVYDTLSRQHRKQHRCVENYIRSQLEYASPVWSALPKTLSDIIESVQKRALKIAYPTHSNDEALQNSNIKLLSTRREEECMLEMN